MSKSDAFAQLFKEAEQHEDYWLTGAILAFTESVVREMERQGLSRAELARRLNATPAYVTKLLRGKVNFTLATMMRLARALDIGLHVELGGGTDPSSRVTEGTHDPHTGGSTKTKVATSARSLAARKVRLRTD